MIRTVFVEADPEFRAELYGLLEFYRNFEVAETFDDVNLACDYIMAHEVDVVFIRMDIGDPSRSGDGSFLASYIHMNRPDIQAVLYDEREERAFLAFRLGAAAFFKIPADPMDFQQVIGRLTYIYGLQQYKKDAKARSLMVKTKEGYHIIRFSDILFIERSARKTNMVCVNGQSIQISNYTMDELERILGGGHFYRCYQSFIVNLKKVTGLHIDSGKKSYTLALSGFEGEIILSREKHREVVELLQKYYSDVRL